VERHPGFIYFTGVAEQVLFQGDLVIVYSRLPDGTRLRLQRGTRQNTMKDLPNVGNTFRMALNEADAWVVDGAEGQA
jgi:putative spermidine/putrescine transport system ATP-binding protein